MELFISGKQVAMNVDALIQVNFVNQLLQRQGFFSYPFEVPLRPNLEIFGYLRIATAVKPTDLKFELRNFGVTICRGNVAIDTFDRDVVAIILQNESSEFWKTTGEMFMDEFDFGGETNQLLSTQQVVDKWTASASSVYPASPYSCYPVYAPNLLVSTFNNQPVYIAGGYPGPYANAWDHANNKLFATIPPSESRTGLLSGNIFTLNFYVRYLIDKIITSSGYFKDADDLASISDFSKLTIISLNQVFGYYNILYKRSLPHIKIADFMKSLEDAFGIMLVIDVLKGTISVRLRKNLMQKSEGKNYSKMRVMTEKVTMEANPTGYTVKWKDADEDDRNYSGWATDATITEVALISNIFPPQSTWYDLLLHVIQNDRYYICRIQDKTVDTDPDVWLWVPIGVFRTKVIGDGKELREIEALSVVNYTESKTFTYTFYGPSYPSGIATVVTIPFQCPKVLQKGNSSYGIYFAGDKMEVWPIIFNLSRGMNQTIDIHATQFNYPLTTFDGWKESGEALATDFNLRFDGAKGLYAQFMKGEIEWLMKRLKAETFLTLNPVEIKSIDFSDKIVIDGFPRVIDTLSAEFGKNETIIVDLINYI